MTDQSKGKTDPYDNEGYKNPHNKALTQKQRAFVEHYMTTGNATESAKLAGYSGHNRQAFGNLGSQLLKNPKIRHALSARARFDVLTLTREERQRMWSAMALDKTVPALARLKASELLAKSQRDFVQQIEQTVTHKTDLQDSLLGAFDAMQAKLQGRATQVAQPGLRAPEPQDKLQQGASQLALPENASSLANASSVATDASEVATEVATQVAPIAQSRGRPVPRIRRGNGDATGVAKRATEVDKHDHVLVEVAPGEWMCRVPGCSYAESPDF
jgi:phage terminase small subunit